MHPQVLKNIRGHLLELSVPELQMLRWNNLSPVVSSYTELMCGFEDCDLVGLVKTELADIPQYQELRTALDSLLVSLRTYEDVVGDRPDAEIVTDKGWLEITLLAKRVLHLWDVSEIETDERLHR